MAKKRDLFSGTLTEKGRKSIEKQLAESRKRDIAAMKKTNQLRLERNKNPTVRGNALTKRYKEEGILGTKKGKDAEDKWMLMKKALGKEAYLALYKFESGDIIDAADYIADNYDPNALEDEETERLYFNKKDMIDTIEKLRKKGYDSLDTSKPTVF